MSSKGRSSEDHLGFSALFLICICVVDSQWIPEIVDTVEEFSYTDGQLHHFRARREASAETLEYLLMVEVNVSEVILIDQIKSNLESFRLLLQLDNTTEITSWNFTTVCNWSNSSYQCSCEDQYFWPCETCTQYGSCDVITDTSCGCINGIPNDGQFCQPMTELNNTAACLPSTSTTASPVVTATTSAVTLHYLLEAEIDAVSRGDLDQLRNFLEAQSFPLTMSNIIITDLNITTVCDLSNSSYQCRCEDQYFWPCETCTQYGSCDVITDTSCGCINGIPNDGPFCQPMTELNNSSPCPSATTTTVTTSTMTETTTNTTTEPVTNTTTEPVTNTTTEPVTNTTTEPVTNTTTETTTSTSSPVVTATTSAVTLHYLLEAEIDAVSRGDLDQLRNFLEAQSFPLTMSNIIITDLNITTVCDLSNSSYQCRCEDQYFWPCETCTQYGSCDVITDTSCGCINGIPNDGPFCQPMTELNNSSPCPSATTTTVTTSTMTETTTDTTTETTTDTTTETTTDTTTETTTDTTTETTTTEPSTSTTTETPTNTTTETTTDTTTETTTTEPTTSTTTETPTNTTTETTTDTTTEPTTSTTTETPTTETTTNTTTETTTNTTTKSTSTTTETTTDTTTETTTDTTTETTTTETTTNTTTETTTNTTTESTSTTTETSTSTTTKSTSTTTEPTTSTTTKSTSTTTEPTTSTTTKSTSTTTEPTTSTTTKSTSTTTEPTTSTTTKSTSTTTEPTTSTTTKSTSTTTEPTTSTTTKSTSTTTEPTTSTTTKSTSTTTEPTTSTTTKSTSTTTEPTTSTTTKSTSTTTEPTTSTTTKSTSTTTTPTAADTSLNYSLTLNQMFDSALADSNTKKYKEEQSKIKQQIDQSYRSVSGYQQNSATVTGFRPGSVIVDFSINATTTNLNLTSANRQLASNLNASGYTVNSDAFSQTVQDKLYRDDNKRIYSGDILRLTCNAPVANGIVWTKDKINLTSAGNNKELQLNNVSSEKSGEYACSWIVDSMPNVIRQNIAIEPYPDIQVSSDRVVSCTDSTVALYCCVQESYTVEWNTPDCRKSDPVKGCIHCNYMITKAVCQNNDQNINVTCQVTGRNSSRSINIKTTKAYTCNSTVFGVGKEGDQRRGDCDGDMVGFQTVRCDSSGQWQVIEKSCVLRAIQNLKDQAEHLEVAGLTQFVTDLSNATSSNIPNIAASPETIVTIVDLLKTIANVSQNIIVNENVMKGFLKTLDVIGSDKAQKTWEALNNDNKTSNASSELLNSVERMGDRLTNDSLNIITNSTQLIRTSSNTSFSGSYGQNKTTYINIPDIRGNTSITIIVLSSLDNVLPVRNRTHNSSSLSGTSINGDVVVVKTNPKISNISLSYEMNNKTLGNPQCVFWNFGLLNGIGGWDSTGCEPKPLANQTGMTCECNHTTPFSILMSPFTLSTEQWNILSYITFIGVGISMACLVLCLIIETIVWKSVTRNETSHMRHVSIVNIALSLLIADIWFIVGAAVNKKDANVCSAATFFIHFFYLALFFWMLLSALLLLYRTIMVFARMSKATMMAVAFSVGYGAPLLIAVVTVASTAGRGGYIQEEFNCWLNWSKTKALLAFVIPALTIVVINLLVLMVVLYKMLRRGVNTSTQPQEKHALLVIMKCVGVLTPLFGLTWGFGIGTMVSRNFGIHVVFAFLNSLQGFFILVFGTLLDSKIREALVGTFSLKNISSNRTRSTSTGPSSSSSAGRSLFWRLRQRIGNNVSGGERPSSSSYSVINN